MGIHTGELSKSKAKEGIIHVLHGLGEVEHNDGQPEQRFWSKVNKTVGCWGWQASTSGDGYGQIKWGNAIRGSHRVSWELHNGRIPDGLFVLHRCDNKLCVCPGHLFLGTHEDNMKDMVEKGRQSRGEEIGISKLTEDNVKEIRSRYAATSVSMAGLAKDYGVRRRTIKRAIRRKTWKHVA